MLSFVKPKSQPVHRISYSFPGCPLGIWSRSSRSYKESDQALQIRAREVSDPLMFSKGTAMICQFLVYAGLSSHAFQTLVIIPLQQSRSQPIVWGRYASGNGKTVVGLAVQTVVPIGGEGKLH